MWIVSIDRDDLWPVYGEACNLILDLKKGLFLKKFLRVVGQQREFNFLKITFGIPLTSWDLFERVGRGDP